MHLTVSRTRLRRSHVACRSSPSGRLSPGRIGFEHTTQRGASVMACSEKRASLTIADFSDPCHDLPQSAQVDRRNPRNRAASRAESAILGPVTFHDILARRAAAHPDREALVDHRHRATYGELAARVDRTAAALQSLGLGPGDVVTIQLPNWVEFAYVFFALERLGAVANQIGPDFRSREVEYIIRFSESRAFVCPASFKGFDYVRMVEELRPRLPDLGLVCVLGARGPGVVSLDDVIYGEDEVAHRPAPLGADDVMRMAFTSGTTGNPKGVIHSHNTTLSACRNLNADMGVTDRDACLIYLPLGLNWGYLTLVQAVMAGGRAPLVDQVNGRGALRPVARARGG